MEQCNTMKTAGKITSIILGIPYLILGSNYFFNFIAMPPMPGDAGAYLGLLYNTGFLAVVKTLEIILSILLISGFLRPLALILVAPISINILLFEVLIAKMPGVGVLLVALNAFAIFTYKEKYNSILK